MFISVEGVVIVGGVSLCFGVGPTIALGVANYRV